MIVEPAELERLLNGRPLGEVVPLHGDGSSRRYFRVFSGAGSFVLLVGPDGAENEAYVRVARHLEARHVRVPRVFAEDKSRGWILLEDLGDLNLFTALSRCSSDTEVQQLYEPVLNLLVRMQLDGAEGFDLVLGGGVPYDDDLRIQWEGMYFVREFATGLLGVSVPYAFAAELERLSAEAGRAPTEFFLHRDFQSRNIQMPPDGPALIDFQGSRPGPLAYDAAALLLDPYVGHAKELRGRLLGAYWERLRRSGKVDVEAARLSWFSLGAFRLLQALGAFGKLGGRLGKPGFLEHASKAMATLQEHLGERGRAEFPVLWDVLKRCREEWARRERVLP